VPFQHSCGLPFSSLAIRLFRRRLLRPVGQHGTMAVVGSRTRVVVGGVVIDRPYDEGFAGVGIDPMHHSFSPGACRATGWSGVLLLLDP
jgi:hypothetical protein